MQVFKLQESEKETISPHYSTAFGETVKGTKVEMGRYMYEEGTGATVHQHPQEQVICILSGRIRAKAGGEEFELGPGDAVLILPDTPHSVEALEETHFISFKDIIPGWAPPLPPAPRQAEQT